MRAGYHRPCKLTRLKADFPTESSLLTLLYAGILNVFSSELELTLPQMVAHIEDRIEPYLKFKCWLR